MERDASPCGPSKQGHKANKQCQQPDGFMVWAIPRVEANDAADILNSAQVFTKAGGTP